MKKNFVIPIAVLLAICVVITGALAAVSALTSPVIAQGREERINDAMRELVPSAASFDAAGIPESTEETDFSAIQSMYTAETPEERVYIVVVSGNGYGGTGSLRFMVVVSDGGIVRAAKTLANNDTKGLGSRVSEPDFQAQFVGMDASLSGFDGIAGATISSNAYKKAVLTAILAAEANGGAAK
ncbi:MAG: FMN-binding protein [Oscillospiraceae bacterium]|nr:FMN-binding protein [Oscillospiraceae bacterium]